MHLNSAKCSLGTSLAVLFYTMKCNIGPFVNTFHNKEVMCEQKAHRWPQSAKLCPEQAERRAKRHRIQHGPPSLSLSLVWFSLSLPFSRKPLHSHQGFPTFPVFLQEWIVGDNLCPPIGWLHTKSSPGKRVFVTAATQIQRLALFFFFFFPPQAHRGTHTTPHRQRKKQKRGGMTYRKQKNPPVLWFHSPSGPEKILTLNPEQQP